jgi:23S rRNA (adenine2503-C2)-methyltransferase
MGIVDLKALNADELKGFVSEMGLPAYRAGQLLHWIYERGAVSTDEITELSKSLRASLRDTACISNLRIAGRLKSSDGTEKFLFELEDGLCIESVLIPDEKRLTLCISSQAGCAMGCKFCLTGRDGLKRNLRAHEIADQVIAASRAASPGRITSIVLMGMGEPLHNLDEVSEALWRITELLQYSTRRVTVSTCGLTDRMLELPHKAPPVNFAVSLNATTDEVRDRIMPVNRRFPMKALISACRQYPLPKRRRITFEYVMMDSLNDTEEDAERLVRIARQVPSKVNLIPFNGFEGSGFTPPPDERVKRFQKILQNAGVTALVRKSKGTDILAACGQLSASAAHFS